MVHVLEDTIVVTPHVRVVTVVRNQSMTDYMSRSTGPSRTPHASPCTVPRARFGSVPCPGYGCLMLPRPTLRARVPKPGTCWVASILMSTNRSLRLLTRMIWLKASMSCRVVHVCILRSMYATLTRVSGDGPPSSHVLFDAADIGRQRGHRGSQWGSLQ